MRWQQSVPRATRVCLRLLCILACAALYGCQPSEPGACWQRYVSALAGSLITAPPTEPLAAIPPPPGALQLAIPENSSLKGLDILPLSGCAVQATIGKRNSSLGRSAKASQRLLLALEYLRLAPACIQHVQEQGNAALAARLQHAWLAYREQLPALLFNATLGSEEFRAFWLSDPEPAEYPPSTPGAATVALQSIDSDVRRWLGGDYRAQNLDFELLLSEIAGGGGAQLQALSGEGGVRNPHRYDAYLRPIAALEQQLAVVLPLGYRHWQQERNTMLTGSRASTQ